MNVIVIGGGWGGVAAALEAASLQAETLLLERTDSLLGTGLVGGIMRNNGRFTVAEEMIHLGGGKLFSLIDKNLRHKNISFPGHERACLYDVLALPPKIKPFLESSGAKVKLGVRIAGACKKENRIISIYDDDGNVTSSADAAEDSKFNYDDHSNLKQMVDVSGNHFGYYYDLSLIHI